MEAQLGSVVGNLANQLRRDIALGIIKPGTKLNIEALKKEYKVSHPSVREALSLLAGEKFVSSIDQKGFRVLKTSSEELKDITRIRAELECLAFEWSVNNANIDWRAGIVAAHHALTEVENEMLSDHVAFALEWDERNRNFHYAIVGNCGSPQLLDLIAQNYALTSVDAFHQIVQESILVNFSRPLFCDLRQCETLIDQVLAQKQAAIYKVTKK